MVTKRHIFLNFLNKNYTPFNIIYKHIIRVHILKSNMIFQLVSHMNLFLFLLRRHKE